LSTRALGQVLRGSRLTPMRIPSRIVAKSGIERVRNDR
jgi:hypothetical protein